jgi:UDP-N-acetylglucosamine transferase subunit ALG13
LNEVKVFVTTGTQLPFPRLLDAVNDWAKTNSKANVIAQTAKSKGNWEHLKTNDFLSPSQYAGYASWADVIIGHAGMGTIITGFEHNKPLILMARLFSNGEHRNDHQITTAIKFVHVPGIQVVSNTEELMSALNYAESLQSLGKEKSENREKLISELKKLIWD